MTEKIRVLIWDENSPVPQDIYPQGIRGALAQGLRERSPDSFELEMSHLDQAHQGLDDKLLDWAQVMLWWGHSRHQEVEQGKVASMVQQVHQGRLGFIALHSAHYSRPFKAILDCSGDLRGGWDEQGGPERIRVCAPAHPIARGVIDFTLPQEEMYSAPFEVPAPECVVMQSHFPKLDRHFPCCACWTVGRGLDPSFMNSPKRSSGWGRGAGRVVYFRPGHETLPTYKDLSVQTILANAVGWTCPRVDH